MKRPKTTQLGLGALAGEELPRWTDPATWHPQPGKPRCLATKLPDMLAKGRAAGLHPMRLAVIETPCQGYEVMWAVGNYGDGKPEPVAAASELPW